ncbi:MAG: UDP-galactopyranose mutase [Clostridiales bacterium]|jgi:UDP-galactopyranose mutase|nr:UDP-galactopyranose mutase [Clostridiales bacterium]
MYDYLVVGAGLFGSVFAYEARRAGKKVLVIDRRKHVGGNARTESVEGINVHKYGAHIFHTDKKEIWDYIGRFAEFNNYINSPIASYKGEIYNLPFNMNTFSKMWNVASPREAMEIIEAQRRDAGVTEPKNLEEQALFLAGRDIYEKLIKGYTEKQWGKSAKELPPFIIKRVPIRFTYDNNYFNDRFQGIPIGGYTQIFDKLLAGTEVRLGCDYIKEKEELSKLAEKIIYTGMIDEYFGYSLGSLEYRSLRFEQRILEESNFQGNAVVNYTEFSVPYTRIIEHKHFEFGKQDKTVVTYEYPAKWQKGDEPYYPVNSEKNDALYKKYSALAQADPKVSFGGRLGKYQYYDMDKTIAEALTLVKQV